MYFVDPGEEVQEIHQKAQLNLKYFVKYYFKNENIDFIKIENIKQEDNFNCGILVHQISVKFIKIPLKFV